MTQQSHAPRRSRAFWNLIASRYAKMPVGDEATYQIKLEQTRNRLAPDMRVLEFGCGTGTTALILAPHVAQIDAIDYAPKMIKIAKAKAEAAGETRVRFEVGTIETWSAAPTSYDAVLGMSILHLVSDPDAVIARVFSVLKPGGQFFSSTVCLGDMAGLARYWLPFVSATRLLPRVVPFTMRDLTARITAQGFEILQATQQDSDTAAFVIARKPD